MTPAAPETLARHGLSTRVLHALDAVAIIVLIISGLALGDVLAQRVAALLGGHVVVDATHRALGLAFVLVWVLLVLALPTRLGRLLRDSLQFRRPEWRWPLGFLRFYLRPSRYRAPAHGGRFDPAQRVVFVGIIAAVALAGASGVYLYLTPPLGRTMLVAAIRLHIASAWLLIACLCVHILAGSGLLHTHRGVIRAMFGDGRVKFALACTLWPAWARRQADADSPTPHGTETNREEPPRVAPGATGGGDKSS